MVYLWDTNMLIHRLKVSTIYQELDHQYDFFSSMPTVKKNPQRPLPIGMTARNMGKNDLWIAATAYEIGASLVTTDKDFNHLQDIFLPIISPYSSLS